MATLCWKLLNPRVEEGGGFKGVGRSSVAELVCEHKALGSVQHERSSGAGD